MKTALGLLLSLIVCAAVNASPSRARVTWFTEEQAYEPRPNAGELDFIKSTTYGSGATTFQFYIETSQGQVYKLPTYKNRVPKDTKNTDVLFGPSSRLFWQGAFIRGSASPQRGGILLYTLENGQLQPSRLFLKSGAPWFAQ